MTAYRPNGMRAETDHGATRGVDGVALAGVLFSVALPAYAEVAATEAHAAMSWEDVYDPDQLLGLNVELSEADYATIRNDETFDIYVPATFWADGEDERYSISIRRKSATAINDKISYRIKIRGQIGDPSVTTWHGLETLSLENGDDQDVVREGVSWFLHRTASTEDYRPGLASWVELTLHVGGSDLTTDVRPQGVYLSVETVDEQFVRNRGLWVSDQTWLYKQDDIGLPELKDWPFDDEVAEFASPAYGALGYSPFQATVKARKRVLNPTPNDGELQDDLEQWVNMETLLRLGAVNAYSDNPDELFNHGKNFYWVDFEGTADDRRLYFPWDLDAAVRDSSSHIYATLRQGRRKLSVSQHPYQEVNLNHPTYRAQFNDIMSGLLDGPMSVVVVHDFLDRTEQLLTPALVADPDSKIGDTPDEVASYFDSLRSWVAERDASVRAQLVADGPPSPRD